jgi:DnaK suppressor protein
MATVVDIGKTKKRLDEERNGLLRDISRLSEINEELGSERGGGNGGVGNHMAEGASTTFDHERNLALIGNLKRTLEAVEAALRRLASGTYGHCEACGNPIDRARLKALPYAMRCVKCQTRLEG